MTVTGTEDARLAALHACSIIDTPREAMFDNIVFTVAQVTRASTVALVMVGQDRNWAKAIVGTPLQDTRQLNLFLRHVIATGETLVVEDALADIRFLHAANTSGPGYRFCVATPLLVADQQVVGCLCLLERSARTLPERQLTSVKLLAQQAADLIGLRIPAHAMMAAL